jgi:hypothetical protein
MKVSLEKGFSRAYVSRDFGDGLNREHHAHLGHASPAYKRGYRLETTTS